MATPTYLELANMAESNDFISRVTQAVVRYARFILGEDPATVNHQRRYSFATQAIQNPRGTVAGLLHAIAADSAFANQNPLNLGTTSDATLQAAVETVINTTVLVF